MKGFYVHLDAIIDLRAGTIRRLNTEAYAEIIRNGYHKRKGDFFEGIDPVAYRTLYEAREMETVAEGTVTNVFQFLYPQVAETMKECIANELKDHERPTLDVNVWPYDFTDDERAYLRSLVYQQTRGIIGVNVFSKDIKELTPAYCAENYHMLVMYDYHHYLNAHSSALIKDPKPFLMLIAPMVYFNTDPDKDEETIEHLKQGINSLSLLEASIAMRICLKFINVDVFSIVYPDERILELDKVDVTNQMTIEELDRILLAKKAKRIPEA